MIKGTEVQVHKNSFVRVQGHDGDALIAGYDEEKQLWRVLLPDEKKELLVPESSLSFRYCVLPASSTRLGCYAKFENEEAQGSCGRGVLAAQDIKGGHPFIQEPPLFVVRSCETHSPLEHYSERWRAYKMLYSKICLS